jgi:monoamine oxidase
MICFQGSSMTDIVIIGAGAAGIAAARHLQSQRVPFTLIEASSRLGGRARTDTATFGLPVDLGGHWLHSPGRNPLRDHAVRLGHRFITGPQDSRYATRDGRLLAGAPCGDFIHDAFDRIRAAATTTDQELALTALFPDPGPFQGLLEASLVAKMGVPLEQISLQDFAGYCWEGDDLPVADGYGALVARLAADLPVRLDCAATRIALRSGGGVRVETAQGTRDAKAAIIAVSTGILAAERIAFDPPLPDWKRQAIADLPLGSCNKIILRFDGNPFGDCSTTLLLPDRGAAEAVEFYLRPDGQDYAVCMFNGPFSRSIARDGTAAMRDYALQRLAAMFGPEVRRRLRPELLVADWDAEPWIRGCFAAARPGRAGARAALAAPVEDRLFFAGEAASLKYCGDIHGAWLTGIDAAEQAIAATGIRRP